MQTFDKISFKKICDKLAKKDKDLKNIITNYGYPPFWNRTPGFETLVYIILEQQVSLASAKAAYLKIKDVLGEITPAGILLLTDEMLKSCYFSRQKIVYARHLAESIISHSLILYNLHKLDDEEVRKELTKIKGIGNWTVDVYLMMAMQRANLFPLGDIALIKSIREVKNLAPDISKDEIALQAKKWAPHQTIAAYLLWHAYLSKRKRP